VGTFRAGVQYDDWRGTAAADNAFDLGISKLLENRGLAKAGEFVVAVEVWVGENHGGPSGPPSVTAFLATANGYDNVKEKLTAEPDPLNLRRVTLALTFEEFFGLFKRFNVVISLKGLELDDRSFRE
jgi:hypothetical protein